MQMTQPPGRREAHKQATRVALRRAAKTLFAEKGFEATSIREIAEAAEVTERTFYRYFDGKESLLAEEFVAWMNDLHEAIRQRPALEAPMVAVERAMLGIVNDLSGRGGASGPWGVVEGPGPLRALRQSLPRPMRRLEDSVADAITERFEADQKRTESRVTNEPKRAFEAQVLGRIAVAALRSALIRHRQLRTGGGTSPGVERLLEDAFDAIAALGGEV